MRLGILILCALTCAMASTGVGMTDDCLTVPSPKQIALEKTRIQTGWINRTPERMLDKYYLPITFHIIRSSSGFGGFDSANFDLAMHDLNSCYELTDLTFYISGAIDFIDDDYFFGHLSTPDQFDSIRQIHVVPNTINIYIAPLQSGFPGTGLSSLTTDEVQGIIVLETALGTPDNPSTLAHEVGHYFDLYHTHTTFFGAECPEGTGCDTLGDLVCDTPADPNLNATGFYNVSDYPGCIYDNYITVPDLPYCDQTTPYDPATDNVMSYSRPRCRTVITAGQGERALQVLLTAENRKNLIFGGTVPALNRYGMAILLALMLSLGAWLKSSRF